MGVLYRIEKGDIRKLSYSTYNLPKRLKLLEMKLDYLYENIEEAIFSMSQDYKIKNFNIAFIELLDYSKEELIGMSIFNILAEEDRLRIRYVLLNNIRMSTIETSLKFLCKNGSIKKLSVTMKQIAFNDIEFIIKSNDMLEENFKLEQYIKNMEDRLNELVTYDKLKTDFFTNISHELRTPLNVILGVIQLHESSYSLGDNGLTNSNKYIKIMKQNCYRLLRLINNLIDITKIDAGYYSLNKKSCNIVSIVEDITISIVDYVRSKGIEIVFDTEIEEKIVVCDPDKIERIVMNLLSNAIKFTPPGGSINVDIFDKGDKIIISVKDSGIGIPEDKLLDVFNRYIQAGANCYNSVHGSGIGLALVKSLIEMHGGTISLKSEIGMGSEFIVELPCECSSEGSYEYKDTRFISEKIEMINIEFSDIYS